MTTTPRPGAAALAGERVFTGGHVTMADGTHKPLSAEEAQALWEQVEASRARRLAAMPDERAALNTLMDAYTRLKELGWREAIYCPKDGTEFEVIEAGSTGIHRCHYDGEWPNGSWWISAGGDLWPSRPILFRLLSGGPND